MPGPVTVRSALELLGSAYALHPAFAEAEIVDMGAGVRPAFADNVPKIVVRGRTIHVNGLYRHGFLLAPGAGKPRRRLPGDRRHRQPGVRCGVGWVERQRDPTQVRLTCVGSGYRLTQPTDPAGLGWTWRGGRADGASLAIGSRRGADQAPLDRDRCRPAAAPSGCASFGQRAWQPKPACDADNVMLLLMVRPACSQARVTALASRWPAQGRPCGTHAGAVRLGDLGLTMRGGTALVSTASPALSAHSRRARVSLSR